MVTKIISINPGGLNAFGIVGIVFIILKLTHLISWKWIWVLSPFWIGLAASIIIITIMALALFWVTWKEGNR